MQILQLTLQQLPLKKRSFWGKLCQPNFEDIVQYIFL